MSANWLWALSDYLTRRSERRAKTVRDSPASRPAVEAGELIERFSIEAIESKETIEDPMNAAPALPFGHLGASWVAFRSKLTPQDEIWSFSAVRSDEWGTHEQTAGYAAVRSGRIVAHFSFRRRKLAYPSVQVRDVEGA